MVVHEEDEEDEDGYEDVVEEPPLHSLHVGGRRQRIAHIWIQGVHHWRKRIFNEIEVWLLYHKQGAESVENILGIY